MLKHPLQANGGRGRMTVSPTAQAEGLGRRLPRPARPRDPAAAAIAAGRPPAHLLVGLPLGWRAAPERVDRKARRHRLAALVRHHQRRCACDSNATGDFFCVDSAADALLTIISADHGSSWRLGDPVGPAHTSECSFAQSFGGAGEVYMYTRIFDAKFDGKGTPSRGIAKSTVNTCPRPCLMVFTGASCQLARAEYNCPAGALQDGGSSFSNATLHGTGLRDAPDCEGSMISVPQPAGRHSPGAAAGTCWFVSAPRPPNGSRSRSHLSARAGCGQAPAPALWGAPVLVDPGDSSYSSLAFVGGRLLVLWWTSFSDPPRPSTGMRIAEVPTVLL